MPGVSILLELVQDGRLPLFERLEISSQLYSLFIDDFIGFDITPL